MNISCCICNELVSETENLVATTCGHLFHDKCLTDWIQRAPTCPQCRKQVTEFNQFRVYPTISDENTEEVTNLQRSLNQALQELEDSHKDEDLLEVYTMELDSQNSELTALKQQLEVYETQIQLMKIENDDLKRNEERFNEDVMNQLISQLDTLNSEMSRLKEQIDIEKAQTKCLQNENDFLKSKVNTLTGEYQEYLIYQEAEVQRRLEEQKAAVTSGWRRSGASESVPERSERAPERSDHGATPECVHERSERAPERSELAPERTERPEGEDAWRRNKKPEKKSVPWRSTRTRDPPARSPDRRPRDDRPPRDEPRDDRPPPREDREHQEYLARVEAEVQRRLEEQKAAATSSWRRVGSPEQSERAPERGERAPEPTERPEREDIWRKDKEPEKKSEPWRSNLTRDPPAQIPDRRPRDERPPRDEPRGPRRDDRPQPREDRPRYTGQSSGPKGGGWRRVPVDPPPAPTERSSAWRSTDAPRDGGYRDAPRERDRGDRVIDRGDRDGYRGRAGYKDRYPPRRDERDSPRRDDR